MGPEKEAWRTAAVRDNRERKRRKEAEEGSVCWKSIQADSMKIKQPFHSFILPPPPLRHLTPAPFIPRSHPESSRPLYSSDPPLQFITSDD